MLLYSVYPNQPLVARNPIDQEGEILCPAAEMEKHESQHLSEAFVFRQREMHSSAPWVLEQEDNNIITAVVNDRHGSKKHKYDFVIMTQ